MSSTQVNIPYIRLQDVQNKVSMLRYVYANSDINYYWSDDFSEQMYIALAQAGFICVSHETGSHFLLLPEMQKEYAVLDFEKLHISKNVKKLMKKERYELRKNSAFTQVVEGIQKAYSTCWMVGKYEELLYVLHNNSYENFELMSYELYECESNTLVAGEIGYITNNIYTSLSGFSNKEKVHANCGTLQLVLLAQHLQQEAASFWNLGHASMPYKIALGAKVISRIAFLQKAKII